MRKLFIFLFLLFPIVSKSQWQTYAPMLVGKHAAGVVVAKNKIYIIGGALNGSSTDVPTMEVYDPSKNSWKELPPMPTSRRYFRCAVIGDTIYALGGTTGPGHGTDLANNEAYCITTNIWSEKAQMLQPAESFSCCEINNKIYTCGGGNSQFANLTLNEVYNPLIDTWSDLSPMPISLGDVAGCGVVGNNFYVIGGGSNNGISNQNFEYDPILDLWTNKTNLQQPLASGGYCSLSSCQESIICMGGLSSIQDTFGTNIILMYDPVLDTFIYLTPDLPTSRTHPMMAYVNNIMYVIGGDDGTGTSLTVNEGISPYIPLIQNTIENSFTINANLQSGDYVPINLFSQIPIQNYDTIILYLSFNTNVLNPDSIIKLNNSFSKDSIQIINDNSCIITLISNHTIPLNDNLLTIASHQIVSDSISTSITLDSIIMNDTNQINNFCSINNTSYTVTGCGTQTLRNFIEGVIPQFNLLNNNFIFSSNTSDQKLKIYDLLGRTVFETTITSNQNILPIPKNLREGSYIAGFENRYLKFIK